MQGWKNRATMQPGCKDEGEKLDAGKMKIPFREFKNILEIIKTTDQVTRNLQFLSCVKSLYLQNPFKIL